MPNLLNKYHTSQFWRGAGFPIGVPTNPITFQQDVEEIRSSVIQILNTSLGERVLYPTFGSKLRTLLFEPYDQFFVQDLNFVVREALTAWEPRILFDSVVLDQSPDNVNQGNYVLFLSIRLVNNPSQRTLIDIPVSSQGLLGLNLGF